MSVTGNKVVSKNNKLPRSRAKVKLVIFIACISLIPSVLLFTSCVYTDEVSEKVSSLLIAQIALRKEQIAEPTPERLEIMKKMGIMVENLEMQRIFIHLSDEPNSSQAAELEVMGITLYLDSWVPPVGAHPTGFLIADMPIDKLEELAARNYVVRLDTAERVLEPHDGSRPQ